MRMVRPFLALLWCALAACSTAATASAQVVTGAAGTITEPPSPLDTQRPRPTLGPGERRIDDMIFDESRFASFAVPGGVSYESYSARPWEFGIVPVAFDADVTEDHKAVFWNACKMWEPAGVACVARTNEPAWVQVQRWDSGCYSYVGMRPSGGQAINLGGGCWGTGTVAHELGHALGLIHEHQRIDRDTYVTIHLENVIEGEEHNFERVVTGRLWTEYDFGSLMHYGKSAFAESSAVETIVPKPEYAQAAAKMGQRSEVSAHDLVAMTSVYNLPPRVFRTYPLAPRRFTIGRNEAVAAMAAINAYYLAPAGLNRPNGLSINGRPDFLGLAAWFFDVYVNTRFAGYAEVESRYNVMANITQTDEWRVKNPQRLPAVPFAIGNALPFDRSELLAVMERLDRFYSAPEGLQRPNGLSISGQPDFLGIAAWIVDIYLGRRLGGASPDSAWADVVSEIQQTDEWRQKHRSTPAP